MRKLERIAQLDSEVGQLKEQNMQLVKEGDCLRGELRQLKDILRFAEFLWFLIVLNFFLQETCREW